MLDGVAAGDDRVALSFAAVHVAARLVAEAMRLVDERLQHGQRIGHLVLHLAVRREGIVAGGEELDPVGAVLDLLADRRAGVVHRSHDRAGQRIGRLGGWRGAPHDTERGDLKARSFDAPQR